MDQAGWGLQYSNQAVCTLTGLTQQRTEGAAFWDLFTLVPSRGAGSIEEVQQAIGKGQPFSMTCRLQAVYSTAASWALASGRVSGSSEAGAGAGSARGSLDSGGIRGPGAFAVTLTPASAPDFRPDEVPIGLPAFASTSNCSAAGAHERYWFATMQPIKAHATGSSLPSSGTATASGGGKAAVAVSSYERMRPPEMEGVQLGPLLGVGASGRTYRGQWHGSDVAVKIINQWDPIPSRHRSSSGDGAKRGDDGSRSGASSSRSSSALGTEHPASASADRGDDGSGGGAPLLEALLSKALSHPHIVSPGPQQASRIPRAYITTSMQACKGRLLLLAAAAGASYHQ